MRAGSCYYSCHALALAPDNAPASMEDLAPMSILASGHILRWFARPLIPVVAGLVILLAVTGILGLRYWRDRQALNVSLTHSRNVFETFDRLKTIIADLEAERHGYLLTLDP